MMRMTARRALGLTLIVALGLSGCYRSIGGSLEPTPVGDVAQAEPGLPPFEAPTAETVTEMPSPFPTLGDAIETPQSAAGLLPGQGGAEVAAVPSLTAVLPPSFTPRPLPTNTPAATPLPPPTQPPAITSSPTVGPTATFTSVPFRPILPSPTYTPFWSGAPVEAQPLGERPPDGQLALAPVAMSPTPYVIAQAQPPAQQAIPPAEVAPQQEAIPPAEVAQQPTLDPGLAPGEATLSVFQMTATQIVFSATATAAAQQGIFFPTLTPLPGQVIQPQGEVIYITATPAGQPGICDEYLISPGETLSRIALTFGVTVNQIAQANNIVNPDLILAGDTILIPCPVPLTPTPIGTISASGVQPGQGGPAGTSTYIVAPGDNLYRISLRFGVTMTALMNANGLNPATMNNIYVGQTLVIPGGGTVVQPTLAPQVVQPIQTPIYIIVTATPAF